MQNLALPLLVLFDGGTNDAHNALAFDHAALLTDLFDRGADFHGMGITCGGK